MVLIHFAQRSQQTTIKDVKTLAEALCVIFYYPHDYSGQLAFWELLFGLGPCWCINKVGQRHISLWVGASLMCGLFGNQEMQYHF